MKYCPYCKISVGGDFAMCPLCQSRLEGEGREAYFPKPTELKKRSVFFKLQLFLAWVIVVIAIALDFHFFIRIAFIPEVHWSLILALWMLVFEYGITRQFKRGTGSARNLTMLVILILPVVYITSYYMGAGRLFLDWVIPFIIVGMLITDFVLAMVDRNGNARVYLLANLLVGVIPYIVLFFRQEEPPLAWIICMIISVILFIGIVIFKGHSVVGELQRRLNL